MRSTFAESGGVITRQQLLYAGYRSSDIRRAIDAGQLTILRRGWYASVTAEPDVVNAVRAGGALTCVTALARRGVWTPPGSGRVHVRMSRHVDPRARQCRAYGRLPIPNRAIDGLIPALACAALCVAPDEFIAVCDSILNQRPDTDGRRPQCRRRPGTGRGTAVARQSR